MYAIVESGGKQYKVQAGQTIEVERLAVPVGETVELDRVLLVSSDGDVFVGNPTLVDAQVRATVVDHILGRKTIAFRYIPKEHVRRTRGHRQSLTRLYIEEVIMKGQSKKVAKKTAVKKTAKKRTAQKRTTKRRTTRRRKK